MDRQRRRPTTRATNSPHYVFSLEPAKDFDNIVKYVIDSEEKVVNGHKLIFTTRQLTEEGESDYSAVMYFEDWGYVVWSFAYNGAEKDELLKIMQNLSLEEDTDYVPETTSSDMVRSDLDLKRREYDWTVNTEFTMHKLGEAFQWGHEARSHDFTVKVTSIKEQIDTNGIPSVVSQSTNQTAECAPERGYEPPAQGNALGNKGNITDGALTGQKRYH